MAIRRTGQVVTASRVRKVAAVAVGGAGVWAIASEEQKQQALLAARSTYRVLNLVSTATVIAGDYAYHIYFTHADSRDLIAGKRRLLARMQDDQETFTLRSMEQKDSFWLRRIADNRRSMDELTEEIAVLLEDGGDRYSRIHMRNATRLRDMCAANGGLYIKLGQHLAMLDLVVPPEYQEVLSSLLGRTPQSSYEAVCRVVRGDLGADPLSLFDTFDPLPFASASLAQVHLATKDGQTFAVKVQHEGLREGAPVDQAVITKVVGVLSTLFEGFDYNWVSAEMNRNVPQELNFRQEANNIAKAANNLAAFIASGDVALPSVQASLSGSRVLTMSFEKGCYVSDVDSIAAQGLSKTQIASLLSRVFWEQIFRHGFVHCDPHPQNLLIRPHPHVKGKAQLVLLDHGLYRQLDEGFRKDYCRLWQGLALSDEQRIETYARRIGAGQAFSLLAAMITQRPWDDIVSSDLDRMHSRGDRSEAVLLRSYAQKYFKEITLLLGRVPSDLLLLFKTADCLRHLDKLLGAPVNTTAVAAGTVAGVLLEEELTEALWGVGGAEQGQTQTQGQGQGQTRSGGGGGGKDSQGGSDNGDSTDGDSTDSSGDGDRGEEHTESKSTTAGTLLAPPTSILGLFPRLGMVFGALSDWYRVQLRVFALNLWGVYFQMRQLIQ